MTPGVVRDLPPPPPTQTDPGTPTLHRRALVDLVLVTMYQQYNPSPLYHTRCTLCFKLCVNTDNRFHLGWSLGWRTPALHPYSSSAPPKDLSWCRNTCSYSPTLFNGVTPPGKSTSSSTFFIMVTPAPRQFYPSARGITGQRVRHNHTYYLLPPATPPDMTMPLEKE